MEPVFTMPIYNLVPQIREREKVEFVLTDRCLDCDSEEVEQTFQYETCADIICTFIDIAATKIQEMVDNLLSSNTEEGLEQSLYTRDYTVNDEGKRTAVGICNDLSASIERYYKSFTKQRKFVERDGKHKDYLNRCTQMQNVEYGVFEPIIDSMWRLYRNKARWIKSSDINLYSDLLQSYAITKHAIGLYLACALRFPAFCYLKELRYLDVSVWETKLIQLSQALDFYDAKGKRLKIRLQDIDNSEEFKEIAKDWSLMAFSIENIKIIVRTKELVFYSPSRYEKSFFKDLDNQTRTIAEYQKKYTTKYK